MPPRRTIQFAAPLRPLIAHPNNAENATIGAAVSRATESGSAMARFFRDQSAENHGQRRRQGHRQRRGQATAASPAAPRARQRRFDELREHRPGEAAAMRGVMVMPSCAPDSWNDRAVRALDLPRSQIAASGDVVGDRRTLQMP